MGILKREVTEVVIDKLRARFIKPAKVQGVEVARDPRRIGKAYFRPSPSGRDENSPSVAKLFWHGTGTSVRCILVRSMDMANQPGRKD